MTSKDFCETTSRKLLSSSDDEQAVRLLEAPFKASFLDWLRKRAAKEGMSWRATLELAWRCEGW